MQFSRSLRCFSSLALFLVTLYATAQDDGKIHMNQIQVVGTHNSYHVGLAPSEGALLKAKNARAFDALDYRHQTLAQQFDAGVRQVEIDIYGDRKGGLYADPLVMHMVKAAHLPADPAFDPEGVMKKPGFKVLHVQDLDVRSSCMTFVACLTQVHSWSKAHPHHVPLFILIETKVDKPLPEMQKIEAEPFTPEAFDRVDAEIRSVFPAGELVTPDDVRGNYETLEQAVLAGNWPALETARGKVVFLMDQRKAGPAYLEGHPSLRGRIIFTNARPGEPDAAFIEHNEAPYEEITALVRKGYLVRSRTDANTAEARTNSTANRDAMMASGAQMLSTDYPSSEPAEWEGHYAVQLPGNAPARCNPVNAPAGCRIDPAF
jgi:hypothetical protein